MAKSLIHAINSFLTLICLTALGGGLVYRFYSLNKIGIIISLVLSLISFVIIQYFYLISNKKYRQLNQAKTEKINFKLANFLLLATYLLILTGCFYILFASRTTAAIISPWQAVPSYFFIFYCLSTLLLLVNAIYNKKFALPLIILHYFLSFSVAVIVYKLGYGYDAFIHQATENLISQTGTVEPKPFYYLGQYAVVVIFHKLTALSIVWLDRLLVPALAAVFLPLALWRIFETWFNNKSLNLITIIALPALTFPFLIATTPQNLAYLFLLLVILLGLVCQNIYDFLIIVLLASAAAITQPVAGIPALLFAAMLAVYHSEKIIQKKYLYGLLAAAAAVILPALFYFLNKNLPAANSAAPIALENNFFTFNPASQENFILNFVYLYGFNLKFIIMLLAFGGVFIAWKYKEQCHVCFVYLIMSLSLFASYSIAARLPFNFLINYEQNDYTQRLLAAAILFLLPFIIIPIYFLLEKIAEKNNFIRLSFAIFLIMLAGTSLYLTYPRYDNYFNSRGFSLSASDIAAVNWISQDAKGDFLVLANQQVSAAALSQFGFKKYFATSQGQIFYYPIPTGSPLYQYYLDMVYKKPGRELMSSAMDLLGVKQGYFVLNKYWWQFPKILAEAKFSAASFQEFGAGEVYVFKYIK